MSANTFGQNFRIMTFGESHGGGLGVVIDGCPAGVIFDPELLRENLNRRRPGLQRGTSARNESDEVEILSGVFQGKTLGTPLALMVRNQDQRSEDYKDIQTAPRIGHADDVWKEKFQHVDHRGGGRSSGRETVARVMAGSVAQMLVRQLCPNLDVIGFSFQIGPFELKEWPIFSDLQEFPYRFPDSRASQIEEFLLKAQTDGESYGGIVGIDVQNPPKGLGQPVFHKLKADLAAAVMSVGATSAFEIGEGVSRTEMKGSEFHQAAISLRYGGLRGGITTGEPLQLKVHFKPTSSIKDIAKKGRHDPCIVPRAIVVIESMVWLVLADHILWQRTDRT